MSDDAESKSSQMGTRHRFSYDDDQQVCRVMPDGEVRCSPQSDLEISDKYLELVQQLKEYVQNRRDRHPASESVPDDKFELAVKLVQVVLDSKMGDDCVPERRQAVIESVYTLTSLNPPAMLLYRYSRLPADVMAPYLVARGRLAEAVNVIETFRKPLPAC